MHLALNTAIGLGSGLTALAVGLATMLLVLWQAPRQRDNQLMALYMATVASWGLIYILLNFAVVVAWDISRFIYFLYLVAALNALATFSIAACYTGLWQRPLGRVAGAVGLA